MLCRSCRRGCCHWTGQFLMHVGCGSFLAHSELVTSRFHRSQVFSLEFCMRKHSVYSTDVGDIVISLFHSYCNF
jgi:hypothetical protein